MNWISDAAAWLWDVITWLPWSQIGLGMGIAAAIPALIGFAFWVAEQRRRPEIEFLWKVSAAGTDSDLVAWEPDKELEVAPGSKLLVEASVRNVGDAATRQAMTNFVVPTAVEFKKVTGDSPPPTPTVVGGQPVAFIPATFDLPPGTWRLQRFELTVPGAPQGVRLVFKLSDHALNASGRRWLPSRLVGADEADHSPYGHPWPPPRPSRRHQWHRVHARPYGRVWSVRGERADARDLRVVAPDATPRRRRPARSPDD